MSEQIQFETPENVLVTYQPAGLGTRFVAWVIDQIMLVLILLVLFIIVMIVSATSGQVYDALSRLSGQVNTGGGADVALYFFGILAMLFGLGSFLYFGLSELFMKGQTLGKVQVSIRVVKADGFSLTAGSILVRNIFRVVDHLPALWIVPFISKKAQRLGDMVASTVVVMDKPEAVSPVRQQLAGRSAVESKFRFDPSVLSRARPSDAQAVEHILERWDELEYVQRDELVQRLCQPLARRLHVEPPAAEDRLRFLEDFLAAEYRRQHRRLG